VVLIALQVNRKPGRSPAKFLGIRHLPKQRFGDGRLSYFMRFDHLVVLPQRKMENKMSTTLSLPNTDVKILKRLIRPERVDFPMTAARAILKIQFEPADHDRMRVLSQKANAGTITSEEQEELDDYERVGYLIDLLHAKARRTLKKPPNGR
jgi:hypothetical protein